MKKFELKNSIKAVYKQNKNTPRIALGINIAINEPERIAGIYSIMTNTIYHGSTKNRTAEQIAFECDENAIELSCDYQQDYLRFRVVCLNEDIETAFDILSDMIKNPTFEEFEKEKIKAQGEIVAELDSARVKALDNFGKTMFKNHYYGNTYSKILENIDELQKQDAVDAYANILNNGFKVLSLVGDVEEKQAISLLEKYFGDIPNANVKMSSVKTPVIEQAETVEIIKPDAQQAQIFQGWLVPSFDHVDYPAILVLNTLLGASGLSSRLFLELRDKKGLAYTVRSSYEIYKTCGNFSIYIATEPKNIQVSLDGFKEEIRKLQDILVSEEELSNAKNNYIGKQQFITETNAQQSMKYVLYGIMGLDMNHLDVLIQKIKDVTPQDVQRVAKTYFTDKTVVSILRP